MALRARVQSCGVLVRLEPARHTAALHLTAPAVDASGGPLSFFYPSLYLRREGLHLDYGKKKKPTFNPIHLIVPTSSLPNGLNTLLTSSSLPVRAPASSTDVPEYTCTRTFSLLYSARPTSCEEETGSPMAMDVGSLVGRKRTSRDHEAGEVGVEVEVEVDMVRDRAEAIEEGRASVRSM